MAKVELRGHPESQAICVPADDRSDAGLLCSSQTTEHDVSQAQVDDIMGYRMPLLWGQPVAEIRAWFNVNGRVTNLERAHARLRSFADFGCRDLEKINHADSNDSGSTSTQ